MGTTSMGFIIWILSLFVATDALATIPEADYVIPELPSFSDLMDDLLPDKAFVTLADVDDYMTALEDLADLHMAKAFAAENRRFKRDALDMLSVNITDTEPFGFSFRNPEDLGWSSLKDATGLEIITFNGKTYWIIGFPRSGMQMVVEIDLTADAVKKLGVFQITSVTLEVINRIAVHVYNNWLWMVLGSSSSNLATVVCINLSTGELLMPQNIPFRGVLGALHLFVFDGGLYLVVGEHHYGSPDNTYVDSAIYMLMDNYFDRRDSHVLRTRGVRDITGFADGGYYYLVFGMESPGGSQVYQFVDSDTVRLLHTLPETDVLKVQHFIDPHDRRNYIIVINNGAAPILYWWNKRRLQAWQILSQDPLGLGSSVGFITLDILETIIFISSGSEITFYVDDDTAHYYPSFTVVDPECATIEDLHGMRFGESYVIFYVCVDAFGVGLIMKGRTLILEQIELSTRTTNELVTCLDELEDQLESRKGNVTYLTEVIGRGDLITTDQPQNLTGHVTFTGGLTVKGTVTFLERVDIIRSGNITRNTEDLATFTSRLDALEFAVQNLMDSLDDVLYQDRAQTIIGPIIASQITADRVEFDSVRINKINGINVRDLDDFLLHGVDQTVTGNININNLRVNTFTTRTLAPAGTFNGIFTNQFMRRSIPDQIVTGQHTYNRLVIGAILPIGGAATITINDIDTSTIVRRGSSVTIIGQKTFSSLVILDSINTVLINTVDLRNFIGQVIFTDTLDVQILSGSFTFSSIRVDGNVDVGLINGVNLGEFESSVVRTTGNYELQGPLVYSGDLVINGDLNFDGLINGISWGNIIDLNSPDLITGNYRFTNVRIVEALRSDNINGLDISEDAVQIDGDQTINGRITFKNSVEVIGSVGVVMVEDATVNGVDPSKIMTDTSSFGDIVFEDVLVLSSPLRVTGDVTAVSINNLLLAGLENRYWRRSVDINVQVSVHINVVVFNDVVTALSINGFQLTDFLTDTTASQTITGSFTFEGPVTVFGNLNLEPGITVDGVDISQLVQSLVTLTGDQTIEGRTEFAGKVTINGDLTLNGKLNGINIATDLMRLDRSQTHTGKLTFTGLTEVANVNIINGDFTVLTINGVDVAQAAADVVLVDEDATITGGFGLHFTDTVRVNDLVLSGTLDEVDIDSLLDRALKKFTPSPQIVTGRVNVRDVHFDQAPNVRLVNGKDWTAHLSNVVRLDFGGRISGTKTFLQPLNIIGDFDPATVNGIDISSLASRILTKSDEQVILNHYTFNTDISARTISSPIIDGVIWDNILFINEPNSLGGTVIFNQEVTILEGLAAPHNVLDGCNLDEVENSAIRVDEQGRIHIFEPVFIEDLVINGNVAGKILVGLLDLEYFLNALVLRSTDQQITGSMEFLRNVTITRLNVDTINGISVNDLYEQAIMQTDNVVLECDLVFSEPLTVDVLHVTSSLSGRPGGVGVLVNGLDLSDLAERAVLKTGGTYVLTGRNVFVNGFITQNLVANSIGSVLISNLVAISRTDRQASRLTFVFPITINGNLQVTGLVDGVDLAHLLAIRISLNSNEVLSNDFVFEEIRITGDLQVETINGVSIADLVLKHGTSVQVITGTKIFRGGLIINGNIQTGLINGLDILELDRTIVRINVAATIREIVTFTQVVRSSAIILVENTVNNFDLSELVTLISLVKEKIENEYLRIDDIRSQISSINQENYAIARGMFSVLAYLDRVSFRPLLNIGRLWFGIDYRFSSVSYYLSVKNCGRQCLCGSEVTAYYQINDDGSLSDVSRREIAGSVFVSSYPGVDIQITLTQTCSGNFYSTEIVVHEETSPGTYVVVFETVRVTGFLIDLRTFEDDGMLYLITVTEIGDGIVLISVLKYVRQQRLIVDVFTLQINLRVVNIDLLQIHNTWYFIVANDYQADDDVDPYRVTSQMYVWSRETFSFVLIGEYLGDHVTSGKFLISEFPFVEYFFVLTQLKAAQFSIFEDNIKYTSKVLVFRYREEGVFEEYECLPVYGVVAQASFTIDRTLYLLLLSESEDTLYVYEYQYNHGFRLYQQITVHYPYGMQVLILESGIYVAVSVSSPPGIILIKVYIKGILSSRLIE